MIWSGTSFKFSIFRSGATEENGKANECDLGWKVGRHSWELPRSVSLALPFKECGVCEWEAIVQGDEGPFRGVAQVLGCHGVTVGHQEREEEEIEQEVEGEKEEEHSNNNGACPWMG